MLGPRAGRPGTLTVQAWPRGSQKNFDLRDGSSPCITGGGASALTCAHVTTLVCGAAPVGITRTTGALAKVDAFATKSALPMATPSERKNALDSLKVGKCGQLAQISPVLLLHLPIK